MQGLRYNICRFCSQKINLLVSLIGITDHAGPSVNMHRTEWRKERKKAKSHTQAQKKSRCVLWYLDAVCSAAMGVLFVWIPCGIPYVGAECGPDTNQ
jgi:hypothetical protein